MIRTQIQLTEEQVAAVKARAAAEGRSMADVIRECLDESLPHKRVSKPIDCRQRALAAIGSVAGGSADLAANHDQAFAEAGR